MLCGIAIAFIVLTRIQPNQTNLATPKVNPLSVSTENITETTLPAAKGFQEEQAVITPKQPEFQAEGKSAVAALQNKEIAIPHEKLQSQNKAAAEDSFDNELRKNVLVSIKLAKSYINSYYSKNDYKGFLDWPSIAIYSAERESAKKNEKSLEWKEKEIKQGNDFDLSRATDYQRSILGIISAGSNPKAFAGMNLVETVKKSQQVSGKFADTIEGKGERLINSHIWGIVSLYSAGEKVPASDKAYNWLVSKQNSDGGFGIFTGAKSDLDMTAMALTAFSILGKNSADRNVSRALEFLRSKQTPDGGFEIYGQENPDTASTVVQGLIALEINPVSKGWIKGTDKNMIDFIMSFQLADGGFSHARGGEADMLATARALTALTDYYYSKSVFQVMKER
ncbi:MAG: prenyltransferase/squalene oxidase repeat-containing protein [Ignavibacteriales bacterium]